MSKHIISLPLKLYVKFCLIVEVRAREKSTINVSLCIIIIEKCLVSSFHSVSVRFVGMYLIALTYNTVRSIGILVCPVVTSVSIWMSSTKIILGFITFSLNEDTNGKNSDLGFLYKISEGCIHVTFLFFVILIIKWEESYLYLALPLQALFVLLLTMSVCPAK